MCTVTWLERPGGFELLCNRDELRSRRPARPPELEERDGVRFLAPRDGDAGGTWIAVNERGLALCLLNDDRARADEPARGFTSRGLLVRSLAGLPGGDRVRERLGREELGRYRPFHLLVLAPGEPPRVFDWDGHLGAERPGRPEPPLSSSSLDPDGAARHRRELLARMVAAGAPDGEELARFHRSHHPRRGPFSPCMHRDDASTVSFSHVVVGARRVSFAYADGPPCRAPLAPPLLLARAAGVPA